MCFYYKDDQLYYWIADDGRKVVGTLAEYEDNAPMRDSYIEDMEVGSPWALIPQHDIK